MVARVEIDQRVIAAICERWGILELALFGSVLRDDFGPESDVDVLVTFAPDRRVTLLDLVQLERELEALVGRRVHVVERQGVEASRNHLLRRHVLDHAEPIYVA